MFELLVSSTSLLGSCRAPEVSRSLGLPYVKVGFFSLCSIIMEDARFDKVSVHVLSLFGSYLISALSNPVSNWVAIVLYLFSAASFTLYLPFIYFATSWEFVWTIKFLASSWYASCNIKTSFSYSVVLFDVCNPNDNLYCHSSPLRSIISTPNSNPVLVAKPLT